MNDDEIKGALSILNKLYWKFPKNKANWYTDEANDIPNLGGTFYYAGNEIKFKKGD